MIHIWTWITFLLWAAGILSIPHVLFSNKRPASALAWVWFLILVPGLGFAAYWIIGSDRMTRRRVYKISKAEFPFKTISKPLDKIGQLDGDEKTLIRLLSVINEIPHATANSARLLVNAAEFYPALQQEIDAAQHHIHIEFFIWRPDRCGEDLRNRLIFAARRGVEVRLLLDQLGCWGLKIDFFQELIEAGGRVTWFNPIASVRNFRFMNLRNHRKLQLIDGRVAFVGGMNIGGEHLGKDERIGKWFDAQVQLTGSVVGQLQRVFAIDWLFATEEILSEPHYYPAHEKAGAFLAQVIAGGPDLPREPIPKTMLALLSNATTRLWISTGYFVPNGLFITALQIAAGKGVDVKLLVSAKTDHPYLLQVGRSFYRELLEWGVRIFEFNEGLNHKKATLMDQDWLMVGSANSDNRSMRLNFELNVLLKCPEEARRLEQVFEAEFAVSKEIHLEDFENRSFWDRLNERAFRPLAPLL